MSLFTELREAEKASGKTPIKEATQPAQIVPSPEKSKIDYLQFGEKKTKKGYVCPSCGAFLDESEQFEGCPSCGHTELRETTLTLEGGEMVSGSDLPDEPQKKDDAVAGVLAMFEDHGFTVSATEDDVLTVKNDKGEASWKVVETIYDGQPVIVATCMKSGFPIIGSLQSEELTADWIGSVVSGTEDYLNEHPDIAPKEEKPTEEQPPENQEQPQPEQPAEPAKPEETQPPENQEQPQPEQPAPENNGEGTPPADQEEKPNESASAQNVNEAENLEPEKPVETLPQGEEAPASSDVTSPENNGEEQPASNPLQDVKLICPDCNGEFGLEVCKVSGFDVLCPDCGAILDTYEIPGEDKIELEKKSDNQEVPVDDPEKKLQPSDNEQIPVTTPVDDQPPPEEQSAQV